MHGLAGNLGVMTGSAEATGRTMAGAVADQDRPVVVE